MKKLKRSRGIIPKTLTIELPFSKSESNRLLIAQAISNNSFEIENLSEAEDTLLLQAALESKENTINVGMAGTAFRFLTAYYSTQGNQSIVLTGAARMKQRPIGILVDALRKLGASISYLEQEGFPPLEIHGKKLKGGKLKVDGGVSSQFISALLLIAPSLETPLHLEIQNLVSKPYVNLTLNILNSLGIKLQQKENSIVVEPSTYRIEIENKIEVGKDWSSAAFFYQLMAFSDLESMLLKGLRLDSFQGDKALVNIYESFGISSVFNKDGVVLKRNLPIQEQLEFNLIDCPDLIPSVAVTAAILAKKCLIKGVTTLRIKESNRVEALQNELLKFNAQLEELGENEVFIHQSVQLPQKVRFKTYKDHRMAMCLAPLSALIEEVEIEEPEVVEKSFPNYWRELERYLSYD